jgi:hypothetical protein
MTLHSGAPFCPFHHLLSVALAAATLLGTGPRATAATPDSVILLPAPTGHHAVGTLTALWVDSTRVDTLDGMRGPRPVRVHIWYPSEPGGAFTPAPYAPGIDTSSGEYGRLLARVRGHSRLGSPFSRALSRAPALVFSTGRVMAPYDYTAIAEDLASHGWVTVGVASPGLSRFHRDDGDPIAPMPATPIRFLQHFDSADVFLEPMAHAVAADLRFVVRKLELVDRTDPILRGYLDLGRLAMMGHSNGALGASRACAEDGRCRAFLGIEGTQTRELRKQGVGKPYGLLISDQSLGYDAENVYRELGTRPGSAYTVVIVKGAGHNSATDLLLIRPSLFHYPIAPARGVEIARDAIRAFLDRNLPPGKGADLRSALEAYPEVEVQTSFP